jgi:hypothetical protein
LTECFTSWSSSNELKGKGALVFSPSRWQPFISSSKEIVGLESLLWAIEIAKDSGTPELLLHQMGFGLPSRWNLDAETIYPGVDQRRRGQK